MRRFFGRLSGDKIIVDGNEFFHLKKVLRMEVGDQLIACVNDDYDYYCHIEKMDKSSALLSIDEKKLSPAEPKKNIVLFQMMPKKDYFDSILPKAIELGVSEIYFFTSSYTMVKTFKRERIDEQVKTACKQCERSVLPIVHDVIKFEDMFDKLKAYNVVIFANEHEKENKFKKELVENCQNIAVIVGNEGGFSEEEAKAIIKNGGKSFTLGTRILRCDTAVIATLTLVGVFSDN